MNDYFARIGSVLAVLVTQSTLNGDFKQEALRLCDELRKAPDDFATHVAEQVGKAAEEVHGRLAALEEGKRRADAVVFSGPLTSILTGDAVGISEEDRLAMRELFNGADPAAFDHDGDGFPGGSLPQDPEQTMPEADTLSAPAGGDTISAPDVISTEPLAVDALTVAQLREELDSRQVGYPSDARKADLQKLLNEALAPEAG